MASHRSSTFLSLTVLFAAGATLAAASPLAAQPRYRVTDLGRLPGFTYMTYPLAMNNRGEVVGFAYGTATYQAFVWDATNGIRALPPVPGEEGRSTTATGINDLGEIVGYSGQSGGSHTVGWLYRNGEYTLLGTLPGYDGSLPSSINNRTEIVGSATGFDALSPDTNFYWSPATGMVNVVPGSETEIFAINDAGVATGGIRSGAEPAPGIMTWEIATGVATDRGALPDTQLSFGYAINESGQIAGASIYISSAGHRTAHSVVADPETGILDLDLFQSYATGINERGEVVGARAWASNQSFFSWIYSPEWGVVPDIRTLVDDAAHFGQISDARAINDRGQVIAVGTNGHVAGDEFRRGFLLSPVLFAEDFEDGSVELWSETVD